MKKLLVFALAALMLLSLCACGGKDLPIADITLADELKAAVTFESDMAVITKDQIGFMMAEMPEGYNAAGYGATGSTAEEILVVICNKEDIKTVESSMQAHLAELADQASKYDPAAVSRIENAKLVTGSYYVVLVIADDTAPVDKVLEGYQK